MRARSVLFALQYRVAANHPICHLSSLRSILSTCLIGPWAVIPRRRPDVGRFGC